MFSAPWRAGTSTMMDKDFSWQWAFAIRHSLSHARNSAARITDISKHSYMTKFNKEGSCRELVRLFSDSCFDYLRLDGVRRSAGSEGVK